MNTAFILMGGVIDPLYLYDSIIIVAGTGQGDGLCGPIHGRKGGFNERAPCRDPAGLASPTAVGTMSMIVIIMSP